MNRELLARYRIDPLRRNLAIRLDGPLLWIRRVCSLVVDELRPPFRLPWRARLRAWRHGYTSRSYAMYELDRNDPRDYVSEFVQKVRTHRINGAYNVLTENKLNFSNLMARCGAPCPSVHAIIRQGRIHPLCHAGTMATRSWLGNVIDEEGGIVVKPLQGFKGKGFVLLRRDGADYLINGVRGSLSDVEALLVELDGCYVSSFIEQAEYSRRIYPRTTNTVRFLIFRDEEADGPFIAMAAHRFGTERSYPVDNWKSGLGGLSARIDLETGEIGPAASMTPAGRLEWHAAHPETGERIAGTRVPRWAETRDRMLAVAGSLPFIPDTAWDLVVTDRGFTILEANGASALFLFQVHAPLLADARVRRFYERHGVIRPAR